MELEEFIQKFCPDYKQKDKKWDELISESINCYAAEQEADALFDQMFNDALENFKKKVCERQRGYCVDMVICGDIMDSKEPTIDEILNN